MSAASVTATAPVPTPPSTTPDSSSAAASSNNNNSSSSAAARKGRGSQVFTQEMACALVEMYYARKKDFPGSGYSLPPEAFEAIATELRAKFNVTPSEIDQQTLKKKLSNIRTRVRNRCRDMRPDADISGLNLTPSEKIYFRYFGPPSGSDTRAGESGASTPLPNGILNDTTSNSQGTGEQNGHSPHQLPQENNNKELSLNELIGHSIIQKYAENLHLFSAQNVSKNVEQQRFSLFDAISKHLLDVYHINMDLTQVRSRIDEVVRSLAQKMDDFRRLSGVSNENIVLRPPNMTMAEAELFDAQFTESPEPRKNYTSNAILMPPPSSTAATSSADQPLVQITDGFYILPTASSNGMPALPEPSNPPSSMLISPPSGDAAAAVSLAATASGSLLPPTYVHTSTVNAPINSGNAIPLPAPSDLPSTSAASAPATKRPPKKNNKRKAVEAPQISDAEMERRFQETIEAVLSPPTNKKTKGASVEEKRDALMAMEKQKTLRIQRQLAEEQLALVQKQMKLADEQIQFYKIWTEIGNKLRGFLRP